MSHTARSLILGLLLILSAAGAVSAGEVRMNSGMTIEGKPIPIMGLTKELIHQRAGPVKNYPILMVDTGLKRVFVPGRQVQVIDNSADLSRYESFELEHKRSGGAVMVQSLGGFRTTPFDEFGRRTVTIETSFGQKAIVQGVTKITPRYLTVTALTHKWEHGLALTSIPSETLDAILRKATDPQNPDDRMMIARFYLQAGLYHLAAAELDSITSDFPELRARAEEVSLELRQLRGRQFLTELRRRRNAGQHELAYQFLRQFPVEDMSAAVLRDVREMTAEYERSAEQMETVRLLLGELQAQLSDPEQMAAAASLRSVIGDRIDHASLPRLAAFLKLKDDDTLPPEEKLALAYSGWMLGSANAITDFDATVALANARFLMLEYCRENGQQERQSLLGELARLESVGPQTIAGLIPLLPPAVETPGIEPGKPMTLEIPGGEDEPAVKYSVLLPQEYTPHHSYPLIIALHPAGMTPEDELVWWGVVKNPGGEPIAGQSQRRGYIVVAPHYAAEDQREYDYGHTAHRAVVESLRDARRRFSVDSDRVFLSGHGMGGDAAFDIGMSHPDLFAGVVPIAGIANHYTMWYWQNAEHVAWYVIGGELDRDSLSQNSRELSRMMRHGYDVTYVEYSGRGYEDYFEEIHNLFDWMDLHKRVDLAAVGEFEFRTLRPHDNRFYWLEVEGLPDRVIASPVVSSTPGQRVFPLTLKAKATVGNTVYVTSGAETNTLWLSPGLVDFEQRLTVKLNGRTRFNDFPEANMEDMLEDYRRRGDRQRIVWRKLGF